MKVSFKKLLFSGVALSLIVSPISPLLAQEASESEAASNESAAEEVTTSQVTAKHEADKQHGFEELLIENGGDVDREHWASESIEQLITKYCGIMVGYPDNTFRGTRQMTRFEMAAALYKLMQCLEVKVTEIPAPTALPDNLLLKSDLMALAALQKELQPELQDLMAKHLDLDKRIEAEEAIQVHGGIQLRYRDRVMVTDGTDPNSPFFAKDNTSPENRVIEGGQVVNRDPNATDKLAFSNNINQFVRDNFGLPDEYHSPSEPNVSLDDLAAFRSRTWLQVDAKVQDWISLSTAMDLYDIGRASSGLSGVLVVGNGGHDINEGLPDGSAFVFRKAELKLQAPDSGNQLRAGLMNFSELLNTGSRFSSLFDQGAWNGRDYGFVGWGGADVALSNTNVNNYRNSLSRYWSGGLNVSMVDPDSKRYNQVTAPALALKTDWGSGNLMLGFSTGAIQTQRQLAAEGNLSSGGSALLGSQIGFATQGLWSGAVMQGLDRKGQLLGNHLALPSQYGDGYAVVGLEQRFAEETFPVRIALAGMHYLNDSWSFTTPTRKEISGALDLGWNQNFGLSLQVNKSFIGYDRHSLGLFFNDIGGSGFDLQVGANAATRGLFNLGDLATGSAGVALGFNVLRASEAGKDDIKIIVGARQSFADNFGRAPEDGALNQLYKDSGLTVTVPYKNVAGSPLSLQFQYGLLAADALWQFRAVAQDIAVIGSYAF